MSPPATPEDVVLCLVVVIVVGYRCLVVLMRGWAVVVLRMIVPEVLVHVQRGPHGRRHDQGLNQRAMRRAGAQRTVYYGVLGVPDRRRSDRNQALQNRMRSLR